LKTAMLSKEEGREALVKWREAIGQNPYLTDPDFQHSVAFYLTPELDRELSAFAERVVKELEPLVIENNLAENLPRIEHYDSVGLNIEQVVHHPSYEAAGNVIYSARILERLAKPGGLTEALAFMFLSAEAGEAGHNCPIACSAGLIRVLQKIENFPRKHFYLDKLLMPSYSENFTGAQFLTEVQGGSDVGQNAAEARQDSAGDWRISGEKWFCSNADGELMLVTARFDPSLPGTKGLGLFLIPAELESGKRNNYSLRRLKNKIGTCSLVTAEIDFHDAYAIALGPPSDGFKMVMENVLHISRLFNTICVLGMARRAFQIALEYARHRRAFGESIIHYPLVKENLAQIKAENAALLASILATSKLQDLYDTGQNATEEARLLLRLLANLNKTLSALLSVEHIHHALDVLAGNGAIETFSTIPRLLRDCIVCENWEGTHNTLRMQILKDIIRHRADELFFAHIDRELEGLKAPGLLLEAVNQLKQDLKTFKAAPPEIQSLQIKKIVSQMGHVFGCVHLLKEGLNQTNQSKLYCLEYLLARETATEKTTLELINKIILS